MTSTVLQVIERVREFNADKDDAWALPPESGQFVHALILACRAKNCVEIGTSYGYSGLWIASAAAANGGKLLTIDNQQRKSDIAGGFYKEAGLEAVVTRKVGVAAEILADLAESVDWALNDADKENAPRYVDLLYPRLPIGGVIVTDNVLNHEVIREQFVPWIRQDRRFFSTLVPVGNGLELSVKIA